MFLIIMAGILYLAEHNSSSRLSSAIVYTVHHCIFLGLIKSIAKFDPILKDCVIRAWKKIQN